METYKKIYHFHIHQKIAKKPVGFCGIFIHYFLKKKKKKKLRDTYLKKYFHPHLNWKVSLFGDLRKL